MRTRDAVLALPDEALVPVGLVRELIRRSDEEGARWIDVARAAAIMDMDADKVRRRARRWQHMEQPPVRVQKTSNGSRSHWRLNEADCWRQVQRAEQAGPRPVPDDVDTEEASIQKWVHKATRNIG